MRTACRFAVLLVMAGQHVAFGQFQNLGSLKTVPVPKASNLTKYVKDQDALLALGKALFWDMQVGSDGRTACATCHFHAGADHRAQNQLSNPTGPFIANYTLTLNDFPFHQLSNPDDNRSTVIRDTAQRAGSAGLFRRIFVNLVPDAQTESGFDAADLPAFTVGGLNVRQVTPRNTPTVINSVFNFHNFWDGRASNIFTGLTPFGDSDPRANALVLSAGQLTAERVRIDNSSLASQAVGPPMSSVEMSYEGRTWQMLGSRLLSARALALQRVAVDDSVLGLLSDDRGLSTTYLAMVQAAFQPEYWSAGQQADGSTQAESNFALFFGLAVQAYEASLVSDDSRYDRFAEGNSVALTAQEQNGLRVFQRSGCTGCHSGPEFTVASISSVSRRGVVQRARNGLAADTGFFRTGVRPIAEDTGLGALDDFGKPYSVAVAQNPGSSAVVNGLFKSPTIRNVEFTGPFFHNGGQATLEQVVEFYSRGGDFPGGGNVGPGVRRLNLNADDKAVLVAFMKALSDERVRFERAPFDHPELCVPAGQTPTLDPNSKQSAMDRWVGLAAVGRQGNSAPLQTFDELLSGVGTDGSRSHTMNDACTLPLQ